MKNTVGSKFAEMEQAINSIINSLVHLQRIVATHMEMSRDQWGLNEEDFNKFYQNTKTKLETEAKRIQDEAKEANDSAQSKIIKP